MEDQIQSANFRLKHRGKVVKKLVDSPTSLVDAPLGPAPVEEVSDALATESNQVAKMDIEEQKQEVLAVESTGIEGVTLEGVVLQENGIGEVDQNTHFVEGNAGDTN